MADQIGTYDDEPGEPNRAACALPQKRGVRKLEELTDEERQTLAQGGYVDGLDGRYYGVGMRFNRGKPPIWRGFISYFPRAIEKVAEVSGFGANKYAWNNWQNIDEWEENLRDSLGRHYVNQGKGRKFDKETKLLEAAHLAWNAMAYLEKLAQEDEDEE